MYATANDAFLVDFCHRARAPQCASFKRTAPHKLKGAPIARGSRRHGAAGAIPSRAWWDEMEATDLATELDLS